MADATFTFKDKKLLKQVIRATAPTHHLAGMLWTMFVVFPLAVVWVVVYVIVHELLLRSNDVHGGLRKDRLNYVIQWNRGFDCYFQTHPNIDAL